MAWVYDDNLEKNMSYFRRSWVLKPGHLEITSSDEKRYSYRRTRLVRTLAYRLVQICYPSRPLIVGAAYVIETRNRRYQTPKLRSAAPSRPAVYHIWQAWCTPST